LTTKDSLIISRLTGAKVSAARLGIAKALNSSKQDTHTAQTNHWTKHLTQNTMKLNNGCLDAMIYWQEDDITLSAFGGST